MPVCRLCLNECARLAKSHIVPLGFFPKGERLLYSAGGDGESRKLANAIWDAGILCDACEHNVMAPLDQFAIRVLKGGYGAEVVQHSNIRLRIYRDFDRRLMRAFLGSLMWRYSVSSIPECKKVDMGVVYEKRIANDLLCNGSFGYIDALIYNLLDGLHSGIMTPCKTRLGYGGVAGVNGYSLVIPQFDILLSLDQRPNPCVQTLWDDAANGKAKVSMSLSEKFNNYPYCIPVMDALPCEDQKIKDVFMSYIRNAKRIRRIPGSAGVLNG